MDTTSDRIRRMLAVELRLEEKDLTDDYRWTDAISGDDVGYFLAKLNDNFTKISPGLSYGAGSRPFGDDGDATTMQRIATVGGLVEFLRAR